MAAGDFTFTNPEAARQEIARISATAAAAENASRERIARETTASNRYLTQSQMAQRDREIASNAALRRESFDVDREIAGANQRLAQDKTRDAETKARAKFQFDTIAATIRDQAHDPHTAAELEALISDAPDLTEDQKKAVRALRYSAAKIAADNYASGKQAADNYTKELQKKGLLDIQRDKIYERIARDPDVLLDRSTGTVTSRHRQPREQLGPRVSANVPTIGEVAARVAGPAAPTLPPPPDGEFIGPPNRGRSAPALRPPVASDLIGPPNNDIGYDRDYLEQNVTPEFQGPPNRRAAGYDEYENIPGIGVRRFAIPTTGDMMRVPQTPETPPFIDMSEPYRRAPVASELIGPTNNQFLGTDVPPRSNQFMSTDIPPRVRRSTALAPPPLYGPPFNLSDDASLPRFADIQQPYGPPNTGGRPFSGLPAGPRNIDGLLQFVQHPSFARLAPAEQQSVLDEIRSFQGIPRAYDLNTLRPEYIPMDNRYFAPQ